MRDQISDIKISAHIKMPYKMYKKSREEDLF